MYIVPCPLYVLAFRKTEVKLKKKRKKVFEVLNECHFVFKHVWRPKKKIGGLFK